jgi:hypothetical protein|tara:strand:- start:1724 stop:2065 length:342 start_codon:yes stop_codon:yes gene_type:complete
MNKLLAAMILSVLGHIIAFFHMNAQFKWEWAKSQWWVILVGLPISYLFYYSTRYSFEYFGYYWNIRLIGFGMGTFIFGLMTWGILGEAPNAKVMVSLALALIIILIQMTNVVK